MNIKPNPKLSVKTVAFLSGCHRNTATKLVREILNALNIKGRKYLRMSDYNQYYCVSGD